MVNAVARLLERCGHNDYHLRDNGPITWRSAMLRFLVPATIIGGILATFPAAAQDVQYVGNSDPARLRSGAAGILEFNEECVLTFGDGARICSSLEIMQTLQTGAMPDRESNNVRQWVVPSIVAGSSNGIDASGLTAAGAQLTCNGWDSSSSTFKGLTVDDQGGFSLQTCNNSRQVACCQAVP